MKTSTLMWIGGGIAVWYLFLRKSATGQATGASTVNAATSGPAVSGPATAPQIDEPDVEYYEPTWGANWGSGFRPNWGWGGGGRRRHGGGGGGHRRRR